MCVCVWCMRPCVRMCVLRVVCVLGVVWFGEGVDWDAARESQKERKRRPGMHSAPT